MEALSMEANERATEGQQPRGLTLTRREGQAIRIGNTIVVRVVRIRGDSVRLVIDAPTVVAVHREEIYDQIVAENGAIKSLAGRGNTSAGAPPPAPPRSEDTPIRNPRNEVFYDGIDRVLLEHDSRRVRR
jgi:carbon storage regulator